MAAVITALELVSDRVVVGRANDRLPDVAAHLARVGTHYLVVLHETTGKYLGIVRLSDIAWRTNASTRILADLVSSVRPVTVRPEEPAAAVSELFKLHRLGEAAVVAEDGGYLGLITSESILEWNLAELKRTQNLLRLEEESGQAARANLKAAAANKEAYLAKLSHDLRSPLNPLLLLASARAGSEQLPEDVRRDFHTIASSAAAEVKLIEEMIDGARLSRTVPPMAR